MNHIFEVKLSLHYANKSETTNGYSIVLQSVISLPDRMCVIDCKNLDIFMPKHVITK